jgi:hypothetical protein
VSGENGTQAMRCNRASAGAWEQFAVIDAGGGKIGLRSMSKFVSSENGAASGITCNRTSIGGTGSWEHFTWVVQPDGKVSLRGNNNMFICSNNGVGAMTCDRATAGAWESFTYTVVGTASAAHVPMETVISKSTNDFETSVYPNPVKGDNIRLQIVKQTNSDNIKVNIIDSEGKIVWEQFVKTTDEIKVDKVLKPGLYYVRIVSGSEKSLKRIVVE